MQVMKSLFNHAVEQRILPIVQSCVYLRPVIGSQGLDRSRKQQPLLLLEVLALMLDEVVYGEVEALAQEFLVRQDVIDGARKAAQPSGLHAVLSLDVAEALCRGGIAQFQLFEDPLFFGVMAAFGIVLELLDDRLQDFVVRPPATIEYLKLVLQNEKQFFDVLMLIQQGINDLRH
jgi:hypothetical protein